MSEKLKQIKRWTRGGLVGFGVIFLILIQVVNYRGMTAWQDPMTTLMWVYLFAVFAHLIFLDAVPLIVDWFKKKE